MDVWAIISMVFAFLMATFGTFKVVVMKVVKAVDEVEDVVKTASDVLKESAEVMDAFVTAMKPDPNGNITITPQERDFIIQQVKEVKVKANQLPKEFGEALNAIKAIFQKKK